MPAIIEMCRALHAESPRYSRLPFAQAKLEARVREMLTPTLLTPNGFAGGFVAEKGDQLIGMISGYIYEPPFTDARIATDYVFYIKPEHRRIGRTAMLLVQEFERWAIENGAGDIIPGTSTMIDAEATVRFYEKMGYQKYGYTLIKRVNDHGN